MKLRVVRSHLTVLLPCVGIVALGALTATADPEERTGSDAPHHERNEAKNERRTAIPLTEMNVPDANKPVRKAKAVETTSSTRSKAKDKKKAAQQAKAKPKTDTTPASVADERPRPDYSQVEDRVGSDAPHQERNADSSKHGARLFIWER